MSALYPKGYKMELYSQTYNLTRNYRKATVSGEKVPESAGNYEKTIVSSRKAEVKSTI